MAPAIVHFLVGSSLLLLVALIGVLRYRISTEHLLWVLPAGGVWDIAPDFHHITPVAPDALYAFHRSPCVEVFALHYTLDQPAIRAPYHQSIFAAIGVVSGAIAVVWGAIRYQTWREPGQSLQAHKREPPRGQSLRLPVVTQTLPSDHRPSVRLRERSSLLEGCWAEQYTAFQYSERHRGYARDYEVETLEKLEALATRIPETQAVEI